MISSYQTITLIFKQSYSISLAPSRQEAKPADPRQQAAVDPRPLDKFIVKENPLYRKIP